MQVILTKFINNIIGEKIIGMIVIGDVTSNQEKNFIQNENEYLILIEKLILV
jgi:hypothetical protein